MYERPYRKPMRYRGHDYRAPCIVHVTLCTHHRQRLFGTVSAEGVMLNPAGIFVSNALRSMHSDAAGVAIDTHIVMPDRVHAIFMLGVHPHADPNRSVSDIVRDFKTKVQRSWPGGVQRGTWEPYDEHLWQRSFYDTLIENDRHLESSRAYILANPARWLERERSGGH